MVADAAEPRTRIPVGVQLWTLRRELAEDLPGTLRQVAEIGYAGVELWFQKWPDPRELKNVLDDCGLKIASAHVNLKDMLEDFPRLRDYHQAIGNTTLVIPYIPDFAKLTPEGWRKTVDDVRLAARAGRDAGFSVLYHNHDFEFMTRVGDVEVFDLIFGTIEKKLLGAEIDVFFVAEVGRDPVAVLRRFDGRLKRVHLKEKAKPGSPFKNTELGRGTIDWDAVCAAAAAAGTEWFLVEQDCEGRPALESIRVSYQFLRDKGLV
jgi:sugar phosphate isomerase/epimerase